MCVCAEFVRYAHASRAPCDHRTATGRSSSPGRRLMHPFARNFLLLRHEQFTSTLQGLGSPAKGFIIVQDAPPHALRRWTATSLPAKSEFRFRWDLPSSSCSDPELIFCHLCGGPCTNHIMLCGAKRPSLTMRIVLVWRLL